MECLNRLFKIEKSRKEKRQFLRFSLSLRAECHYNAGETAEQCRIVDMCEQGLGFELDAPVTMRYGQNVLLKIFLSEGEMPLSAIVRLTWIRIPSQGFMTQRVGSHLLFMDGREKALLLQHAYAEILYAATREAGDPQAFRA